MTFCSMIMFRKRIHLPLSFQPGSDTTRRIILLGGDLGDFQIVIMWLVFDVFLFGNSLQNEVFFQQRFGFFAGYFFAACFAGRQFPVPQTRWIAFPSLPGPVRDEIGVAADPVAIPNLRIQSTTLLICLTDLFSLGILQTIFHGLREPVSSSCLRRIQSQFGGHLSGSWSSIALRPESQTPARRFSAQFLVVGKLADLNSDRFLVVGLGTDHQFVKTFNGRIGQAESRPHLDCFFFQLATIFAVVRARDIANHEIVRLDRFIDRHHVRESLGEVLDLKLDVVIGEFVFGASQFQTFPLGNIKFRVELQC